MLHYQDVFWKYELFKSGEFARCIKISSKKLCAFNRLSRLSFFLLSCICLHNRNIRYIVHIIFCIYIVVCTMIPIFRCYTKVMRINAMYLSHWLIGPKKIPCRIKYFFYVQMYVWTFNPTLFELDLATANFLFLPQWDHIPHLWYILIQICLA